uniref:Sirtuin 3 n=1 Tax=Cyclopterus lumpus TaxID=8103 RepID=A0A8C2WBW6_CYCLU
MTLEDVAKNIRERGSFSGYPDVMRGAVPKCPTCTGVVKPDIVFFGEELPRRFFKYLADFPRADLLVVMGTSLEVEPFAGLADAVRGAVPRLLINRDPVGPFAGRRRALDVVQLGDVVAGVRVLVDALGWTRELDALMVCVCVCVCETLVCVCETLWHCVCVCVCVVLWFTALFLIQ